MKELIHFSHGNGFPSLCYLQMLKELEKKYDYFYIDKIGHSKSFPVTENWHHLVNEIINNIENNAQKPVIGVGHSMGGVLNLLAAIEKPHLFKSLILLDSPLLGRFKSTMVSLAKRLGIIDRITPAFHTQGRRNFWETKEEIVSYLKKRYLFKEFTSECLEDYIEYAIEKNGDGYSLCFDPKIEYSIYRTIPHTLYKKEGKLKVPAALIYGDRSTVVSEYDVRYMQKKYNMASVKISGTHMFPMEHPVEAAQKIFEMLQYLANKDLH